MELDEKNVEGIRVNFKGKRQKGWMLIRKSVHDPVIVLDAESYVSQGIKSMMNLICPFFRKYKFLDMSEFNKGIK